MKDLSNDAYAMFLCFFSFFLSDFLYKSICCGYSFELHQQVDAIQMGTHNICLYKEVDKKYTGCNLKTRELLDCALIGVYAVIRSDTVFAMHLNNCCFLLQYVKSRCSRLRNWLICHWKINQKKL